jgi:hypothetical protein
MPRTVQQVRPLLCAFLLAAIVAAGLGPAPAAAQVPDTLRPPVGFSEPATAQPIDAYRLPDWHFSTLTLRGDAFGSRSTFSFEETDQTNSNFQSQFAPDYRALWESEERVLSLDISPSLDYASSEIDRSSGTSSSNVEESRLRLSLDARSRYDRYVSDRTFLRVEEEFELSYDRTSRDPEQNPPSIDPGPPEVGTDGARTFLASSTRVGVGWGRVRDVTPVIRALRVDERLRSLGQEGLSTDAVQAAARQFARVPGYEAVYDRPDKYFWGEFFDAAGGTELSSLETFYVADVLREPVGRRFEGAEVVVGPDLRVLHLDTDFQRSSRFSEDFSGTDVLAGGFLSARWFENPSLRHQFGAEFSASYLFGLSEVEVVRDDLERQWNVRPAVSWNWLVADRLRLDTRLFANVAGEAITQDFRTPAGRDVSETETLIRQTYGADATATVFIENRLAVDAGAQVLHRRTEQFAFIADTPLSTTWDLQFRLSFRYFLFRSLR